MRKAFLIMAYKDPDQLQRLVTTLSHEGFDFYLHIDDKIDIRHFQFLEKIPRVFLIQKRIKVRHAGSDFTEGVMNSIKEIIASGKNYDFITMMSGQDYPVRPAAEVYEYFESQPGKNFVYIEEQDSPWWDEAIVRIKKYDLVNMDFKGRYRLQPFVNLFMPNRKFPLPYTLYGGPNATWWTLTPACAQYVINFVEANAALKKFFYYTWGPDEFLFPTIILNSEFRDTVVNDLGYRYVDWSLGGGHPKILTSADLPAILKSGSYMARKFDINQDAQILDLLDKRSLVKKAI